MSTNTQVSLNDIVALSKRRGFIFAGSEIYGGLANTWDYGPLGTALKKNLKDLWWKEFIDNRFDMVGLDTSIILNSKVWEASGHLSGFADAMIDCKTCKARNRADHLIEDYFEKKGKVEKVEGKSMAELTQLIVDNKIKCPTCGTSDFTEVRSFNLLFPTKLGILAESESTVYLRGETAQGIFVNFKNITNTSRVKLPFGAGGIGKSFRNEITKGQFIFRTVEFEQGEIEYFFDPKVSSWEELFDKWLSSMQSFLLDTLGIRPEDLRVREHEDAERSFYSKRTVDIEYRYPFGFKELWGLAYRTDYDLGRHQEFSGQDLTMMREDGSRFLPHVIEPAVGIDRLVLMILANSYWHDQKNNRIVLKLKPKLAPYKVAVFPLLKNNPELQDKAQKVFQALNQQFRTGWDDRGNIGKRYYYQDEMGTPLCVTVDHQTLVDDTVTVRDRDTTKQERVKLEALDSYICDKLEE
jgi:glycyl-tRNA synthetase